MELKRIIATVLTFSLFSMPYGWNAIYAIEENKTSIVKTDKFDYINLSFWDYYNDPNLKRFIVRAVESNHDLKIAAKNAEIYYQNIKATNANRLPTIGAGFSPAYSKMPLSSDFDWGFNVPVYVNYEADIFLKNRDKTLSAKKEYEMSLLDEKAAYISIASMVGTVYFNILKLNKAIKLQEDIVSLRKQTYDIMKISNEEGIIPVQDLINADKSYVMGNAELINLKKEKLKLENALAVLVGVSPNQASDFEYSDLEEINFSKALPSSIDSYSIIYRPDYMKAEKNVEKAGINVRVAKKEFLPSINITGLSLFRASEFGSIFTTKNALASIGGALAADLFTGGKKAANLKMKKNEYEIALQNYEKTNLTAIQEVNDALVVIKHDIERLYENKKQNELEIKDFKLRELRHKEGVISLLDLIQAKENLLSVKKMVLLAQADCLIDYIGLYKVLGAKVD